MAQSFFPNWYELTANVDQAFIQAENNDNSLRSSFSGSAAPANPVAGQLWFDTDTGTMKLREIDSTWQGLMIGTPDTKLWMYTNEAQRGWLIDSSVTDVILALRGGNYGSTGGILAGQWDIAGLTVNSNTPGPLRWKNYTAGRDEAWDQAGNVINLNLSSERRDGITTQVREGDGFGLNADFYTDPNDGGHDHPISHNALWRPRGAVGTMQYPNLA